MVNGCLREVDYDLLCQIIGIATNPTLQKYRAILSQFMELVYATAVVWSTCSDRETVAKLERLCDPAWDSIYRTETISGSRPQ